MTTSTAQRVVELLSHSPNIRILDITGGAPELNENFRYLVQEARLMSKEVIDRCNLTVFFEPGQEDTANFLAHHKTHVIASLPCYSLGNVEKQRGKGVFDKSIQALQILNKLGYGKENSGLVLDLVYNPIGASLPPDQKSLELDYKDQLLKGFGIKFNSLFTITNMPIKRFLHDLRQNGRYDEYMGLLKQNFNPMTVKGLMCRDTISVAWDGSLHDCDFNQMLHIPISWRQKNIYDIENFEELAYHDIAVADHCYGCTAGSGSSCGGALSSTT